MAIKRIVGIGAVLILVTLAFAGVGAAEITSSWSGDTLTFTGESTDTLTQADLTEALQKEGHTTPYNVIVSGIGAISNYTFYYITDLVSVDISSSVTSIGGFAFGWCDDLESISIGSGLSTIGDRAFLFCSSLTSITVDPNNQYYKSIDGVLYSKEGKTIICYPADKPGDTYTTPTDVTCIGVAAFANCSNLTSVDISSGATIISINAFAYSPSITTVVIPEGVLSIGIGAFYYSSGLTSITIPNSVTSIGSGSFESCVNLESITIPKNVTSIDGNAFRNCTSLSAITVDTNNPSYKSIDGVLFNKDGTRLICYPGGKTDETYTIDSNVVIIGHGAFSNCPYLKTLNIPSTLTDMDYESLSGCRSLLNINVDDNNPSYKDVNGVLYSKDGTMILKYPAGRDSTSYEIISGVTTINKNAFYFSTNLTSITIPDGVTVIGHSAFFGCTHLISVVIPDSVTTIDYCAFSCCYCLRDITIPDSVTSINIRVFEYCYKLESISMPKVTSIGESAFQYCSDLTSVSIPKAATIGNFAFYNCSNLTSINIPSATNIGTLAFSGCSSLKYVSIPDSTNIGDSAFSGCTSLNCAECLSGTPDEEFMDKFGNKSRIVWYLVDNPGTTTYDNRYVVSLDGGVLKDGYVQSGYSLPSATDIAVTGKNFVGWYDDNEYITEHTGDIVAGTMVYAKYDDVKGTDVSLTVGLSYTFTIPASAQLSTVKGNYVYYDVGIQADIREKNNKLVITLNSEPAGTDDEIDYFKVINSKGDANYQVGKVAQDTFTPIGGLGTHMAIGNELISMDMNTEDHAEGYVGFKTITLPSYSGTYTGNLNFLIKEVANDN